MSQGPILFTESALKELKKIMSTPDFDQTKFLRVGVKGGGCSGFTYLLGFDEKQAADELYEFEGLQYIMLPAHGIYVSGMEIDWIDGLNARGFSFNNPNASKSCGCGSSFST